MKKLLILVMIAAFLVAATTFAATVPRQTSSTMQVVIAATPCGDEFIPAIWRTERTREIDLGVLQATMTNPALDFNMLLAGISNVTEWSDWTTTAESSGPYQRTALNVILPNTGNYAGVNREDARSSPANVTGYAARTQADISATPMDSRRTAKETMDNWNAFVGAQSSGTSTAAAIDTKKMRRHGRLIAFT